jgi:hypothetical protein
VARDYLEEELEIGDQVLVMLPGYSHFVKGTIVKLGKKKATIKPDGFSTYNRVQFFNRLIKI